MRETLRHVGRPILFTTLTIGLGFSMLLFSSFKSTAVFGIMMMLTMLAALLGDMILPEIPPARADKILNRLQSFISAMDFNIRTEESIRLRFAVAGLPANPPFESGEALLKNALDELNTTQ